MFWVRRTSWLSRFFNLYIGFFINFGFVFFICVLKYNCWRPNSLFLVLLIFWQQILSFIFDEMFVLQSTVAPGQEQDEGDLKCFVHFINILDILDFNRKLYWKFILFFFLFGWGKKILIRLVNDNLVAVVFIASVLEMI